MVAQEVDKILESFVSNFVYSLLMIFVIIAAINQLGVQTTSLIAIMGAAGLAIGLALQGSLANFAAGVLIVMFRPYKVGDFVEAAGISGSVVQVQILTTVLKTGDNKQIIVPNGQIMSSIITNYSANDTRRVELTIGIGYVDVTGNVGGLVSLKGGVDGIAFDADGEWLYFAAINQSGLFRVRLSDLREIDLPPEDLGNRVERYSDKPLSDGLSTDVAGNVYITDVEHSAVFIVGPDRDLRTIIRSPKIRWADALSFGPGGWLYLADSAVPELVLKSRSHIRSKGPYHIFRFQPGFEGIPGH